MAIFLLPPAGQRHQHQALSPRLLPDAAAHLVAVQFRQTDIEQHGIGTKPLGGFDGFNAVVGLVRLMSAELQQHRQRFGSVFAVVDDQDATAHDRRGLADGRP